jgi:hypothetical protein
MVVTDLAVLAPSALSVALLAEIFRVVGIHFLGVLVHLVDLVKSEGSGLLRGERVSVSCSGIFGLEMVHVGVLLL